MRFKNADEALLGLVDAVLMNGKIAETRGGRVSELRHVAFTIENPLQREILHPLRKANYAAQIVETMWVLAGRNDIAGIQPYLKRAPEFSDDGTTWRSGYDPRLRSFGRAQVDQLRYVVKAIAKDPGTRQAVISLWDPEHDGSGFPSKDTACNNWLNFSVRDEQFLDLDIAIRSNDLIWGWSGINQFEWSVLQEIVAGLLGLQVGQAHYYVANLHVYERHWQKANEIWTTRGTGTELSETVRLDAATFGQDLYRLNDMIDLWFVQEENIRRGLPSEIEDFPEPMMREWLRVLKWYWSGRNVDLEKLESETSVHAALYGVKPAAVYKLDPFATQLIETHNAKDAAYGNSWKKRGEVFSILPNIARKIDRIGTGKETPDENFADTCGDLVVYLAKYAAWLVDPESGADKANVVIEQLWPLVPIESALNWPETVRLLTQMFEELLRLVEWRDTEMSAKTQDLKIDLVSKMLTPAYHLAGAAWIESQK